MSSTKNSRVRLQEDHQQLLSDDKSKHNKELGATRGIWQ